MDLHSRHPQIIEQDFLTLDLAKNEKKWEAISLSLVVNFVPSTDDRGMSPLVHVVTFFANTFRSDAGTRPTMSCTQWFALPCCK